jgi:hypothetical protein
MLQALCPEDVEAISYLVENGRVKAEDLGQTPKTVDQLMAHLLVQYQKA